MVFVLAKIIEFVHLVSGEDLVNLIDFLFGVADSISFFHNFYYYPFKWDIIKKWQTSTFALWIG